MRFRLGKNAKAYIGNNGDIQLNKISENTLLNAAVEFLKYPENEKLTFDIDDFSTASHEVFSRQENEYLSGKGFRLFSLLTLAFLQMGIIETEQVIE